jgi:hypothetical protein
LTALFTVDGDGLGIMDNEGRKRIAWTLDDDLGALD